MAGIVRATEAHEGGGQERRAKAFPGHAIRVALLGTLENVSRPAPPS